MQFVHIDHREFNLANVSYIEGEEIEYREGSGGPPRIIELVRIYWCPSGGRVKSGPRRRAGRLTSRC